MLKSLFYSFSPVKKLVLFHLHFPYPWWFSPAKQQQKNIVNPCYTNYAIIGKPMSIDIGTYGTLPLGISNITYKCFYKRQPLPTEVSWQ